MKMHKIVLKCRTISPMFMYGSDKTPELRSSEFKGMIRYWWRLLKLESDHKELRKKEAEIFGGTQEEEGKSKVRIKVYPQPKEFGENLKKDYKLDWSFNRQKREHAGIEYLLYSTILGKKEKTYIKPDFEFYIEITSNDSNAFRNATNALWAAIYLGGFGTRSRRGAGSIEVKEVKSTTSLSLEVDFQIPQVNSHKEIKEYLEKNIKKIYNKDNKNLRELKYPSLYNAKILILEPKNQWINALNEIGINYLNYRKKLKKYEKTIFGLPLIGNPSKIYVDVDKSEKTTITRMASPLIISLIRSNNKVYPIMVKLSVPQIIAGKEVKYKYEKWQNQGMKSINDSIINQFLESINLPKEEITL
jgi:CRISPR-associated protein Cmr1